MSAYGKKVLLVGDSLKVKEFQNELSREGVGVTLIPDPKQALAFLANSERPDGIVFIIPVYWESISEFVEKIKTDPRLSLVPLIYLGDFIESNDQVILKAQGVFTLTLGPVPTQEAVRFILSKLVR